MTITIRPEDEQLIALAMRTGAYESPDDVVRRALEVLRSEDQWLEENKDAIAGKIERAFDQFERGQFYSAEQSRADMEKRKAEWLRARHS